MAELIKFLLGPEEGLKREFLEKEKQELLKTYPDLEIHNYYPADTEEDDLIRVLYDSSLFATHRLIIIRHYEDVSKDSKTNSDLVEFLKSPTDDVTIFVLSLTASTFTMSQKVLSLIDTKKQVVMFYELYENQKRDWIIKYFKENELYITNDGVEELLEMVDNNTEDMRHSTENLTIYLKAKGYTKVTSNEISSFLQHTKQEDSNTLFEYVATKNLASTLACLQSILLENKQASVPIVSTLLMRFRQLESLKEEIASGESFDTALSNVKIIKTNDFMFSSLNRKKDKDAMRMANRNYNSEEIKNTIRLLLDAENVLKALQTDLIASALEYYMILIIKKGGKETTLNTGLFNSAII